MSDNVVDITEYVRRLSSDLVWIDGEGVKWFKYTCSYSFEDKNYCFDLWAKSLEDADERMSALRQTGIVDGQIVHEEAQDD